MRQQDLCKGIQSKKSSAGDLGVAGFKLLEQLLWKWELILLLKNLVFSLKPIRKQFFVAVPHHVSFLLTILQNKSVYQRTWIKDMMPGFPYLLWVNHLLCSYINANLFSFWYIQRKQNYACILWGIQSDLCTHTCTCVHARVTLWEILLNPAPQKDLP